MTPLGPGMAAELRESPEAVERQAEALGAVLADLARHVAFGLHESEGADPAATLKAIHETFSEQLTDPPQEGADTPPTNDQGGAQFP